MNITHNYGKDRVIMGAVLPSADDFVHGEYRLDGRSDEFESNAEIAIHSYSLYGRENIAALRDFLTSFLIEFDEHMADLAKKANLQQTSQID